MLFVEDMVEDLHMCTLNRLVNEKDSNFHKRIFIAYTLGD